MVITRIFDLLDKYKDSPAKDDALCFKQNGSWTKYSSQQYIDMAYNFCYGLYEMGYRKGDLIVTVSTNRPEWNFVDMGMSMLGVVHVPVFTSLNSSELEHILNHSGARMVIVSDGKLYKCMKCALDSSGNSIEVFTFDPVNGIASWLEVVEKGRTADEQTRKEVELIKAEIDSDTFATLIYTSGTTGDPKGVMLSHRNLVSNFTAAAQVFNLKPSDKFLSILPLCHVGAEWVITKPSIVVQVFIMPRAWGALRQTCRRLNPMVLMPFHELWKSFMA